MDTLSYELQSDVSKHLSNKSLFAFYQCTKLSFILRKMNHIQSCSILKDEGTLPAYHITKIHLKLDEIPKTIRVLIIKNKISLENLPPSVKYIKFNFNSDHFNSQCSIPSSVTHLIFGFRTLLGHHIKGILPKSLRYLKFDTSFNQNIDDLQLSTPNLQFLQFGDHFNNSVDELPVSLKYLSFGYCFNQHVNKLPLTLTHLKLGRCFSRSIDELPQSIEQIILTDVPLIVSLSFHTFIQKKQTHSHLSIHLYQDSESQINNLKLLYPTIKRLKFRRRFNQSVDQLPSSVIFIHFGYYFNQSVDHLPSSLETVIFGHWFDKSIDNLPQSVNKIIFSFDGSFNQPISQLPSSLTYLKLSRHFDQSFDHIISPLRFLKFGSCFNMPINHLPETLVRVILGDNFNQSLDNIPQSVKYLTVGYEFCHHFDHLSLISLTYNCMIVQTRLKNIHQPLLKRLEIIDAYYLPFEIPKSVEYLIISKEHANKIPKTVKYVYFV